MRRRRSKSWIRTGTGSSRRMNSSGTLSGMVLADPEVPVVLKEIEDPTVATARTGRNGHLTNKAEATLLLLTLTKRREVPLAVCASCLWLMQAPPGPNASVLFFDWRYLVSHWCPLAIRGER